MRAAHTRLAALLMLAGCAEAPGSQSFTPDCHHQADQADGPNVAVSCMVVNNYIIGGTATASPPTNVTLPTPGLGGVPLPLAAEAHAVTAAPPPVPSISGASITTGEKHSGSRFRVIAAPPPAPSPSDIWAQSTFRFARDAGGHLITEPLRAPP